jgi:hypothetical protein
MNWRDFVYMKIDMAEGGRARRAGVGGSAPLSDRSDPALSQAPGLAVDQCIDGAGTLARRVLELRRRLLGGPDAVEGTGYDVLTLTGELHKRAAEARSVQREMEEAFKALEEIVLALALPPS